jgi:hypothetical protein
LHISLCNTRTPDEKRDPDILLEATSLAWWQPVLPNVKSVVGGVDNIGVVQLVTVFQASNKRIH